MWFCLIWLWNEQMINLQSTRIASQEIIWISYIQKNQMTLKTIPGSMKFESWNKKSSSSSSSSSHIDYIHQSYSRNVTSAWKSDFGLPQNLWEREVSLLAYTYPFIISTPFPCNTNTIQTTQFDGVITVWWSCDSLVSPTKAASFNGPQHSIRLYLFELEWKYTLTKASISSWCSLKNSASPYSTASRTCKLDATQT